MLLDHGQDDLAAQAAGDPVQGALPGHGVAVRGGAETRRRVQPKTVAQLSKHLLLRDCEPTPPTSPPPLTCQSRRPPARPPWPTRRPPPGPPSWSASGALEVTGQRDKVQRRGFFFFFPLRNVKVTWTLTSLSHDGRVLPQHGRRRLRQRDDHLQRQLPLHVGQVGVGAQLERDG